MSSSNSVVADALSDFFTQLYNGFAEIFRRFFTNTYKSFSEVTFSRWTKVIISVVGYLIIRPYIESFFKKMHERDRKKQQEKERAKREGTDTKKAKMSANELRGGGSGGKVLGEVENTDDELGEVDEFATASGVPEWGKNTRKRMKKHRKNLEKEAASGGNGAGVTLSEDQIKDLLDWSESEDEKKA